MSEFSEYIKLVFLQKDLVEAEIAKTAELDKQDQMEQERFIVALGN
jgi:hypothetical protein